MKKVLIILISSLLLVNCKSVEKVDKKYLNDDIGFRLYNVVENYYYAYLNYPQSTEEIIEHFWSWLNNANDYRFSSFEDYMSSLDKIRISYLENIISFLNEYKHDISIKIDSTQFILRLYDNVIQMNKDFCRDKARPWDNKFFYRRFYTYDSIGKRTKENYEDELWKVQEQVISKFNTPQKTINEGDTIIKYLLLRYGQDKILTSVCPEDVDIHNEPFLKDLSFSLDTFMETRKEVKQIQLLVPLYK